MHVTQSFPIWTSRAAWIEPYVCAPGDREEDRQRKVLFTLAVAFVAPAGVIWGAIYQAFGERTSALFPFAYAALTALNIGALAAFRRFLWFQRVQLFLILVLPAALQVALGGFVGSSAVIVWSFIAVLLAVLFNGEREARWWFAAFLIAVGVVTLVRPELAGGNTLPRWLIVTLFALNLGAVSSVAFVTLQSFTSDRRRLRELELAYLNQEVMLRQKEKLATLGTMAAGVAHELNNPAAAVARSAADLAPLVRDLHDAYVASCAALMPERRATFQHAIALVQDRLGARPELAPLVRADREDELHDWLAADGVGDSASAFSAALAASGFTRRELEQLTADLPEAAKASLVTSIARLAAADELLHGMGKASERISAIVAAVRSYAFLDQAPVQLVDIPECIENTLGVLGETALAGIAVDRSYEPGLPRILAHGSELNEVWMQVIRNALDAMDGSGTLKIRARGEAASVVVEIQDSGPGMPADVVARAFDPFFTTKPPGKGAGLGLTVSHNVVVRQHGGRIVIESVPGRTVVRVSLPNGEERNQKAESRKEEDGGV